MADAIGNRPDTETRPVRRPQSVDEVLARLRDELARGELIGAYDTAERARRDGLDHPLIRYRRVLALARAGATESAAKEYAEYGLGEQDDIDSRALRARILKDRALAAPASEQVGLFEAAADAYRAIHTETGHSFPGINAATLYLLAGHRDRARAVAAELLDDPELRDGYGYWDAATRAEAQLILGDAKSAIGELTKARSLARDDWGDLSSTRRQLRRLLDAAPIDGLPVEHLLDILRPPRVAHLTAADGDDAATLRETLAPLFREHEIGFACTMLWTDESVALAEAALAAGIELNLVLPFDAPTYLARAEAELPPDAAARRRACIEGARSVVAVTADGDHADAALLEYAGVVATGLARTRARVLSTDCITLPAPPPVGRAPVLHEEVIAETNSREPVRELRALLFADAKGFSKLPESDLPLFWSRFMTEMAAKLDEAEENILYRNSWGDAVFCVSARIETAAEVALSMQERAAELREEHPQSPVLRIGLHHGPVFRGWDPVRRTPSYFGTQVSRAARVEPIVPPGDVYVTEPFAAVLAATETGAFEAEYVGVLPLHKDYGEHRMYRLARRWTGTR